jgi:hypothetical protein
MDPMTENKQQTYQEWAGLYSVRQPDNESQDHSGNDPSQPAHFKQKCLACVCFIFLQEQSQNHRTLQPWQMVSHDVLRQQENTAIVISPQTKDTSERKVCRYS